MEGQQIYTAIPAVQKGKDALISNNEGVHLLEEPLIPSTGEQDVDVEAQSLVGTMNSIEDWSYNCWYVHINLL
jgi:hypothetical protein|eukprot:scaffold10600_cov250-Chaetoceros_neogracile.AAC.5